MKPTKMTTLLVTYRGEVAIRLLQPCAELDIKTVAVYTSEDLYSLHRYKAGGSCQVGEDDNPLKPYLDTNPIVPVLVLAQNCYW